MTAVDEGDVMVVEELIAARQHFISINQAFEP